MPEISDTSPLPEGSTPDTPKVPDKEQTVMSSVALSQQSETIAAANPEQSLVRQIIKLQIALVAASVAAIIATGGAVYLDERLRNEEVKAALVKEESLHREDIKDRIGAYRTVISACANGMTPELLDQLDDAAADVSVFFLGFRHELHPTNRVRLAVELAVLNEKAEMILTNIQPRTRKTDLYLARMQTRNVRQTLLVTNISGAEDAADRIAEETKKRGDERWKLLVSMTNEERSQYWNAPIETPKK